MIRINLLSDGKKTVTRKKKPPMKVLPQGADLGRLLLLGALLIGFSPFGVVWLVKKKTIENKTAEVQVAEAEVQRLQAIIKEVEEFKAKKAELEHKIEVISQLKQNQRGPVRLMDLVSRALPELLWLDRMTVVGNSMTLTGQAFNTNAVASFMDNLDQAPELAEPILRETRQAGTVYSFTISVGYSMKPATPTNEANAPAGR
jgi:Tfp pilus assembly protein PilN